MKLIQARQAVFKFSIVLAIAAAVAGCDKSSPQVTSPASSAAPADGSAALRAQARESAKKLTGEPLKVGLLAPLSGPVAILGKEMPDGAHIAATWVNEHGGMAGRPVEIHPIDSRANPEAAVAAVRELSDKGIKVFMGAISSSEALAIMTEVERVEGVFLSTIPHTMAMTQEQFSKNTFRISDNAAMRQRAQAKLIAQKHPAAKRWLVVFPNNALGQSAIEAFKSGIRDFAPKDVELVGEILAPFGATDYRNVLSQIISRKPDVVLSGMYGGDAVTFYQQGLSMDFFKQVPVVLDNANEWEVFRALKGELPPITAGFYWLPQAYQNDMSTFLTQRYESAIGKLPGGFSSEPFAALLALQAALKANGGKHDTASLISALEGLTFESPTGARKIRAEDHQAIRDVVFATIKSTSGPQSEWGIQVDKVAGEPLMMKPTPGKAIVY